MSFTEEFRLSTRERQLSRSAPPLQSLQAFLLAVRATSFRAAADELALSPSAFSRRIQSLEAFLGVALYDRSGPLPRLTEPGERYWRELEPAMEAIEAATIGLRRLSKTGRLRLMCPPSFAINWLMPRLRTYNDCTDGQAVDIVISRDLDALRLGRADLAIASGPRAFDGLPAEPFLAMKGAVVSAPVLAGGHKPPRSLDELSRHPLLAIDPPADLPCDLWSGWLSARGYRGPKLPESQKFDTWALMYEAASNGMGVTIAVPAVSETYLRDGRLKPCFGGTSDLRMHYSLVYANGALKERPDVRALATWMMAQIRESIAHYEAHINTP
jgi:LysR family transcriptional regulator, glycine cleavage system transcriptional activator